MIPKDIELRKQWRKELETWGPENIRIALNNQTYIPNINREFAWEWLRDQDNERPNKDRQYAKWNLRITAIAAVAGIVAAIASVWTLLR
ncbi:MAG: hypothetical protein WBF24_04790 [Xanthobacteraceae bacterium]